jgi:hypothetical protein
MIEADSVLSTPPLNTSSIQKASPPSEAHAGSVDSLSHQPGIGQRESQALTSDSPKPLEDLDLAQLQPVEVRRELRDHPVFCRRAKWPPGDRQASGPTSDCNWQPGSDAKAAAERRKAGAAAAGNRNRQKLPAPDRAPRHMVACRPGGGLLAGTP